MEPHRRKDTPPRRESGSEHPEEPAPEQPVDSHPEEQTYSDTGVYEEAPQQYVDPNQQYVEPDQQYVDPNQQYVEPDQQYVDPATYDEQPAPESAPPPPPPIVPNAGVYDEAPAPEAPAPAPVTRTPKKKVVRRAGSARRPATPRSRSTYRRSAPSYAGGGGISVMSVFMFLVALGMVAVIAMVMLPKKSLETISGYPNNPMAENSTPRNLLEESQKVMMTREAPVSFTEKEVNQYLNDRLSGQQSGLMATIVQFKGIYVDFTPGLAEIIVEREIFGKPLTTSAKVTAEPFKSQIVYRPAGWSIGRIELGTRNIKPIIDMFMRLRDNMGEEFATMKQMVNVKFENDRITLDPTV